MLFSACFSLLCITAVSLTPAYARALGKRSINGPVISSNFPDPSVTNVDGTWYAFSTNSDGKHIPTASSTDFVNWVVSSDDALPTIGAWSTGVNVWAPDVIQLVTFINLFYLQWTNMRIGRRLVLDVLFRGSGE
jgi:beta-xylosidase